MEKETTIIGYKGFDKNLQCRDFQYEVGKTFPHCSNAMPSCFLKDSLFHEDAFSNGNGKYIPLTEDNLVIGCCGSCANFQNEDACGNGFCRLNECESTCGQWCKGFKEREHERGFDD